MEWLFRLVQEPRRLFWRYLSTNLQFGGLVARQLLRRLSGERA
jgi:N-acetylglucosaminyldiphosphoundecaprenol N-acetyl-beta-D-mannosaminyltransferase